jgi:hypothetical protein
MTLPEILDAWGQDSKIDKAKLADESLRTTSLHHKYINMASKENLHLAKEKTEYNKIMLEKFVLYTEGARDIETLKKYPNLPRKGGLLKTEAEKYILADEEIIQATLKLSVQQEKVDLLRSILASISKRNYDIRASIDHMKFMAGGN